MLLANDEQAPHGWAAKVADFGMARELRNKLRHATESYSTITHMPPEHLSDGIVSKVRSFHSTVSVTLRGKTKLPLGAKGSCILSAKNSVLQHCKLFAVSLGEHIIQSWLIFAV